MEKQNGDAYLTWWYEECCSLFLLKELSKKHVAMIEKIEE